MYIKIEKPSRDESMFPFAVVGPFIDEASARAALAQRPDIWIDTSNRTTGDGKTIIVRAFVNHPRGLPILPALPTDYDDFELQAWQHAR